MKITVYQIDAFTNKLFGGNPAAVCPLKEWLPDDIMQKIGMENNLSETAFYVEKEGHYEIRWFTPAVEVDLCGHATLASGHALFSHEGFNGNEITFISPRSGILKVKKCNGMLTLDFPIDKLKKVDAPAEFIKGLGNEPIEAYKGKSDYMLVYSSQKQIEEMKPDFNLLGKVECRGVIVTAKGESVDFVSRFFAPAVNIPEDPVTGSAHTTLIPYWAHKLGKNELSALQVSKRVGTLSCKLAGERVEIAGHAKTYMTGEIEV